MRCRALFFRISLVFAFSFASIFCWQNRKTSYSEVRRRDSTSDFKARDLALVAVRVVMWSLKPKPIHCLWRAGRGRPRLHRRLIFTSAAEESAFLPLLLILANAVIATVLRRCCRLRPASAVTAATSRIDARLSFAACGEYTGRRAKLRLFDLNHTLEDVVEVRHRLGEAKAACCGLVGIHSLKYYLSFPLVSL